MRKRRLLASIAILVALAGCRSTGAEVTLTEQTSSSVAAASELPEVDGRFEVTGHFRHAPSGANFPEVLGVFERRMGHRYELASDNFSFRYRPIVHPDGLKVDVYVYPRGDDTPFENTDQWFGYLGKEMSRIVGGMKHHYSDVEVVEAMGYSAPTKTGKLHWMTTEATFVKDGSAMTSWSYIAAHGRWKYKLRMTIESSRADTNRELQKVFFDEFSEQLEVRGAQPTNEPSGSEPI